MKKKQKTFFLAASILVAFLSLGIGGFVYYHRSWEIKKRIQKEIKLAETTIGEIERKNQNNRNCLEEMKNDSLKKGRIFWLMENNPLIFDWQGQEEVKKQQLEKRLKIAQENYQEILEEYQQLKKRDEEWIVKQKNWKTLVAEDFSSLVKFSPGYNLHQLVNAFLQTIFYRTWSELAEKKIIPQPNDPEVKFCGFGGFYCEEEKGKIEEMGLCVNSGLKPEEVTIFNSETKKISKLPITIKFNGLYLLNRKKNGGMNKFFFSSDSRKTFLNIEFDEFIGTMSHELAHAIQMVKSKYKPITVERKANGIEAKIPLTQCESSGKGTRDSQGKMIKAEFPELVAEHTWLTQEIKKIIESHPEYPEFKKFWLGE